MIKLKKLISDELKIIRHRRLVLSIQMTITTWIVEVIAATGVILVGVTGNVNKDSANELTLILYTIVLPGIVIIRDSDLKEKILMSSWYVTILDKFGVKYRGPRRTQYPDNEPQPCQLAESNDQGTNDIELSEASPVESNSSQSQDIPIERFGNGYANKEARRLIDTGSSNNRNMNNFERSLSFQTEIETNASSSRNCEIFDIEDEKTFSVD